MTNEIYLMRLNGKFKNFEILYQNLLIARENWIPLLKRMSKRVINLAKNFYLGS